MRYDNILIDSSNFYMRAYAVNQDLTAEFEDGTKVVTGGIWTALKMITTVETKFLKPDGKIYFLFDNYHSGENRRKLIDPDYKANRTKKDDSYYRSMDLFQTILLNYKDNFYCVKREGFEADDLVDTLVKTFPADEEVLLVSNDLDWFRSIGPYCHVAKYEAHEYVIYRPADFVDKFGFEPSVKNVVLYKCFRGDTSDNVPAGVPGIREKDLNRILNDYESITDLLSKVRSNQYMSDGLKKKIAENASRLLLNEKLVSFQPLTRNELLECVYKCSFNPKILKSVYTALRFDIAKIDPRVMRFPDKNPNESKSGFFKFDKANRI